MEAVADAVLEGKAEFEGVGGEEFTDPAEAENEPTVTVVERRNVVVPEEGAPEAAEAAPEASVEAEGAEAAPEAPAPESAEATPPADDQNA